MRISRSISSRFLSVILAGTAAPAFASAQADAPPPANAVERAASQPAQLPLAPASANPAGDSAEDIRDIRGMVTIPDPYRWIYPTAAAAATIGIAVLGFRLWRRRNANRTGPSSASEIARQQLDDARELMKPGNSDIFASAVSDILRAFLEKTFHLGITHQTTEEFFSKLATASHSGGASAFLQAHRDKLNDFLQRCDLAKFARGELSVDQMGELRQSALGIVNAAQSNPEEGRPRPIDTGSSGPFTSQPEELPA